MATLSLARLINRKLIRISGPDCYPYLQGLICNDLRRLYEPDRVPTRTHANISSSVISSFMLNAQGRVICDILLYRTPRTRYECSFTPPGKASEHDELLIECDSELASGLANTLYGYRVRRNVSLEIVPDYQIWCLYPSTLRGTETAPKVDEKIDTRLMSAKFSNWTETITDDFTMVCDPRINLMGLRIIANSSLDATDIAERMKQQAGDRNILESSYKDYITHRYDLGLGEGLLDHPEGGCLPLECNADLTSSVSFDKGCYLGQELTARIHYTGVVRKRLMPAVLSLPDKSKPLDAPLVSGSDIIDETGCKKLGILRNVFRNRALVLMRTDLIDSCSHLMHAASKVRLTTWKPYWWKSVSE